MRAFLLFLASLMATLLPIQAHAQLKVLASIEPLAMLARELLGDQAQVETLMLPSQNPHFASFTPGQLRKLEQADVIIWLGAEAEPHAAGIIERVSTPQLSLLSLDGIYRLEGGGHGHAEGADHVSHGSHTLSLDQHLWLAPDNMSRLASALVAKLVEQELVAADQLTAVHRRFEERMMVTSDEVRALLAPLSHLSYLSHHDPWGYFAAFAGLQRAQVISDSLAGSASARRFAQLAQQMEASAINCVLMEPEARQALLRRLCQGDCRLVELDPLGRDLGAVGYTDFLQHLGRGFAQCLTEAPASP